MTHLSLSDEDYEALLKFIRVSDLAGRHKKKLSRDDIGQLTVLMPEIRKMMQQAEYLYKRIVLETAETRSGAPRGSATIIIDSEGMILQSNKRADVLLDRGRLLAVKHEHLFAVDDSDKDTLSSIMENALGNTDVAVRDYALIGKRSGIGVHQLLALPVPVEEPPFPWMDTLKLAAVVVIDPKCRVKVIPEILKKLYRITPAEIDLINAMANGIKPVQYAAQVHKSVATVQSQRQAVFHKVGVTNQLELMCALRELTMPVAMAAAEATTDKDSG